jgi:predicted PurR-regulated permease PerM
MSALFGVDSGPAVATRWLTLAAISAAILAGIAICALLYVARPIVLPMAAAFILSALLAPIANGLSRFGVPVPASGGVTIAFALAGLVFAVMLLDRPAIAWFHADASNH